VADSELIVRLRGENSDLKAKLAEVTNASKTSANSMSSVFTGALGKIGSAIGVTFSVQAVVNFAKQSVQAFMESERAATALANTMKNMGADTGQTASFGTMVDDLERMSGFDDAVIAAAFQDLMIQTGNSAKATQALNVAMDLAASSGDSLAVSGQKVYQVMTGQSRAMRTFGMSVREGATDMDYLKELGGKMAGSLEANLGTLDGQTRALRTSFDNLKEAIGAALAPIVTPAIGGLTKLFDNISLNNDWTSYLWTLEDPKQFDQLRKLGNSMGNEWKRSFLDGVSGTSELWDNNVFGRQPGTEPVASNIYSPIKNAFKSAWEPISLMGGNLPELTKYIGNLRQASKMTLQVDLKVTGGATVPAGSPPKQVADKLAQVAAPAIARVITHGAGWTPGRFPGGGSTRFATQD
jgi:hypothetical protein